MASDAPYVTLDAKGRATLPEEVRSALGVSAGDMILLEPTGHGTYEMTPAHLVPRDQLWFHDPTVQERILQAEAEIASGRSLRTETPEEAQDLLDGLKGRDPEERG